MRSFLACLLLTKQMRRWHIVLLAILVLLLPSAAEAHSGPPYVVVSEQTLGAYTVTVWADPDVGGGSIIVEATRNGAPIPDGSTVTVQSRAADGQSAESTATAERQQTNQGRVFIATLPFDREGAWTTTIVINGSDGEATTTFDLQVTPALSGWVSTLLCSLPFLGIAALWVVGIWLQRRKSGVPAPAN